MKVVFNCCTQPARYTHNAGVTLFKGEKPETVVKSQVVLPDSQPVADTVTISPKQPAAQTEAKPKAKPEIKSEVAAAK